MSRMIYVESTHSTNDYVKEHHIELQAFDVVYTFFQDGGKGRRGHVWYSDENSLIMSIFIKEKDQNFIKFAPSLAIYDILKKEDNHFYIKWPNDIYYNNRKIGGILVESVYFGNELKYSIIGIGLNINQTSFPSEINRKAISLKQITKKNYDIHKIIKELQDTIKQYFSKDFITIFNGYKDHLIELKKQVIYKGNVYSGIDLFQDGKLLIQNETQSKLLDSLNDSIEILMEE